MKEITLTNSTRVVLVDDVDEARVKRFKWRAMKIGYAARDIVVKGLRTVLYMHVFLMGDKPDYEVHHKNGDGFDNRRQSNLRFRTHANNLRGFCKKHKNNKSGFRGVSRDRSWWKAQICHAGVKMNLGYFKTRKAAALARDTKARKLGWPEDGMNFPRL